ncbi:MAG TPA: putative LPS assembly protein LptD [Saprospiraceae bacterium]|nr:putative LPS assembly protein LptD [Saprospiraceae bacterium]
MKSIICSKYLLLLVLLIPMGVFGQVVDSTVVETQIDTINILSLGDSLRPDSAIIDQTLGVKISKDAVTETVNYSASDSNWTSITLNQIRLYGKAAIKYQDFAIDGDSMTVDFDKDMAYSYVESEKYKRPEEFPKFKSGETEAAYRRLAFNFKTKKAFVNEIRTQEGEFFLLGTQSKYVSKENDTIYHDDKFYNRNALITTCNHPSPHFGIRTMKLKVVPDKLAVVGPSQLEIFGVPTPLVLPFGFFPLIQGQSSGIIFPSSYDYNSALGFGFREVGYYFPINDYIDARVTGDIYTRGTHAIRVSSSYRKNYAYTGSVRLGYSNNIGEGIDGKPQSNKSFSIGISHNQDSKAHPYRTLGGSINLTSNQYNQRTFNDAQSVLNNSINSSFSYNYRWPDSPFKISVGLEHNQNNQTRNVSITLPRAALTMNSITPFKRKNASGEERWYERMVLGYGASMKNYVETTDTTIFSQQTLDNIQAGLNHAANLSTNFRVFNYINVSPSANYEETYFLRTFDRTLDQTLSFDTTVVSRNQDGSEVIAIDTTFGTIKDKYITSLRAYRNYNVSINANTQLFLTKTFTKGFFRGFRHIVKPNLSFGYSPNTERKYLEYVDTDARDEFNNPLAYNPFQGRLYNASLSRQSMALSYGINNIFEGKYYSKKDSIEKRFKFFENVSFNGNYNFAADSLKWSDVSMSGTTRIFKGLSNLNISARFTPYKTDASGRRINKLLWEEDKKLLKMSFINASFNTGLTFKQISDIFKGKKEEDNRQEPDARQNIQSRQQRSFSNLFDNFRISHNLSVSIEPSRTTGKDSLQVNVHGIQFTGSIPLTENWNVQVGNFSYDLKAKKFVYPSFAFTRNLHCWNMSFAWYPSRDVYSFYIGVTSSALSFIKYDYGQRNPQVLFGNGF